MKRSSLFTGLIILAAMQFLGQTVVWDMIWESGMRDTHLMSALWWTWTSVQIAFAIPVGIHLLRWGFARFAAPRVVDRLPQAWVESAKSSGSRAHLHTQPRSAMLSA